MYYENAELFARDLTAAAADGQSTGDYSRYHAIQRQLAAETAAALLSPYASELSALARDRAIKEMDSRHPGFESLLKENREVLEKQRPRLSEAISFAEHDPRLQADLLELYEVAHDSLKAMNANAPTSRAGAVGAEPATTSLATSADRQRLISSFEEKFGDVDIDRADTSQQNIG